MNRLNILWCFLVVQLIFVIHVAAQKALTKKLIQEEGRWCDGMITLETGESYSGSVRFSENTGMLSFKNGTDNRSFTANSVQFFQFYDEDIERTRTFYSLPYELNGDPDHLFFFEVLKEFKSFALLTKIDPIDITRKTHASAPSLGPSGQIIGRGSYTTTEVTQTETIYFMTSAGEIKPYVQILERNLDSRWAATKKNKMINKDLLQYFVGNQYEKLAAYINKNDLDIRDKKDLLNIFDYYEQLISD